MGKAGKLVIVGTEDAGEGAEPVGEVWERIQGETINAYECFCIYRDMKDTRSLLKSYRSKTGRNQVAKITGQWLGWYTDNEWKKRAEAYDAYLESLARKESEKAYIQQVQAYQEQLTKLSSSLLSASIVGLNKAGARLNTLKSDDITPALLPNYLRSLAAIAESAVNAKAMGLGVDDILKQLANEE